MPTNIRTPGEIAAQAAQEQREQRAAQRQREKRERSQAALEVVARVSVEPTLDTLTDEDLEKVAILFPDWEPDVLVLVDEVLNFDDVLYRVVQEHTTQDGWEPPDTPALFARYRDPAGAAEPWEQLTPPETYDTGDEVTHPNPQDDDAIWLYRSLIDANTAEPGQDPTNRWWEPVAPV